jgi:hypothetical protein
LSACADEQGRAGDDRAESSAARYRLRLGFAIALEVDS